MSQPQGQPTAVDAEKVIRNLLQKNADLTYALAIAEVRISDLSQSGTVEPKEVNSNGVA